MSLKSIYQSYLANSSAAALSDNASLNYISTLTTINTAASIVKHNAAHQKLLKKKEQRVLDCIEGNNAITVDVETTLEFISGGGAYLPGLDDNFVSDRVVTFPMVSVKERTLPFSRSKLTRRPWWHRSMLFTLTRSIRSSRSDNTGIKAPC